MCALKNKSPAIVQSLIRTLSSSDARLREDAWRGLRRGVPEESKGEVASGVISILRECTEFRDLQRGAALVPEYADDSHIPELESISARFDANSPEYRLIMSAIGSIRSRMSRNRR